MAYLVTRAQLKARARRKADCVGDDHTFAEDGSDLLDDECNDLISEVVHEVFLCDPERFAASDTITVVDGTFEYELPEDFQSLLRVDDPDGYPLDTAPPLELDRTTGGASSTTGGPYYRLIGGGQDGTTERLHIRPNPTAGEYALYYVATPPVLAADDDELDCRFDEHRYIIAGLAAFCATREESDPTPFLAEQGRALVRIQSLARRRDAGRAKQINDVRSMFGGRRDPYPRP